MISSKEVIEAGQVLKPHGYKGELNAVADFPAEIFDAPELPVIFDIDGILTPFFLESVRGKGSEGLLLKFDGMDSDTQVRRLVNRVFYLRRTDVAEILGVDPDELDDSGYDDIAGYDVIDSKFGRIGRIDSVESGVEYDYLSVTTEKKSEILIPCVEDYILDIDDNLRIVSISLPDGFLANYAPGEFKSAL